MYRSMVGGLIYLTITRLDLSYALGLVSQFMQQPTKLHFNCIRIILRYVKATQIYGLFYWADLDIKLEGYTDVDWATSQTYRRSTSGYICYNWEVQLFHGVARNKLLLHYQVLKLNIEELQQLHVKKYGLEDFLLILESIQMVKSQYGVTI